MSRLRLRLASAVTAAAVVSSLALPRAYADEHLPPTTPPPASAHAANGEYVAPLQQQTQAVYMPQSVALSGPRVITDFEEGDQLPPGYHAETRVRKGLVIGGAITFGVMYMFSALAGAAINDANRYGDGDSTHGSALFVPVAGPFIQMGQTSTSTGNVVLAIDGLAQAAGAAMLIGGIFMPRTVLVRNDLAEVHLVPMKMGQNGAGSGLGLVGTF